MTTRRTKPAAALAVALAVAVLTRTALAQDMFPPPPVPDPSLYAPPPAPDPSPVVFSAPDPVVVIPEHLVIKNQYFVASPAGFRSYLESIKTTNPQLYAQLSPDVDRLESRVTAGRVSLGIGFIAGLATMGLGFASRSTCTAPSITDPNFAADTQAWGDCNSSNIDRMAAFGFLGVGVMAAGLIAFFVTTPKRGDLLDVINKHNNASADPLHLQIGYDPSHQLAQAGAAVSF